MKLASQGKPRPPKGSVMHIVTHRLATLGSRALFSLVVRVNQDSAWPVRLLEFKQDLFGLDCCFKSRSHRVAGQLVFYSSDKTCSVWIVASKVHRTGSPAEVPFGSNRIDFKVYVAIVRHNGPRRQKQRAYHTRP